MATVAIQAAAATVVGIAPGVGRKYEYGHGGHEDDDGSAAVGCRRTPPSPTLSTSECRRAYHAVQDCNCQSMTLLISRDTSQPIKNPS